MGRALRELAKIGVKIVTGFTFCVEGFFFDPFYYFMLEIGC